MNDNEMLVWRPRPVAELRLLELEDGAILQDFANCKIHSLNGWATVVWLLCDGQHTAQEIVTLVAAQDQALWSSVIEVLGSFCREGLVQ